MRLWRDEEPHDKSTHRSAYETLGYVIDGRAELTVSGDVFLAMSVASAINCLCRSARIRRII